MVKTLVYQMYLFGFLDKVCIPTRFYEESPIARATKHLRWPKDLGADVVWLGPIFKSAWHDHGYDIDSYSQIESRFGDLAEFKKFINVAHAGPKPVKVIVDLVLNHTSIAHRWFDTHPEYYCWSDEDHLGWHNLFSGGSAWKYVECEDAYYLHLFDENQADLNWYPNGPDGGINQALVDEFRKIVDSLVELGVDGFRLDVPQAINKDLSADELQFEDLLNGHQATEVINVIFKGHEDLFLMMECFDPTFGEIVKYYTDSTPVDFVCNVLIKDEIARGELRFLGLIAKQSENAQFMLDLESHDAPRFPSREIVDQQGSHLRDATPEDAIWYLFNSGAQGICLYQGQELGLENPTIIELPDILMMKLDAQTTIRYIMGEELDDLRPTSRANARVPLPVDEYSKQEQNPSSYYNLTKRWIRKWRTKQ